MKIEIFFYLFSQLYSFFFSTLILTTVYQTNIIWSWINGWIDSCHIGFLLLQMVDSFDFDFLWYKEEVFFIQNEIEIGKK